MHNNIEELIGELNPYKVYVVLKTKNNIYF